MCVELDVLTMDMRALNMLEFFVVVLVDVVTVLVIFGPLLLDLLRPAVPHLVVVLLLILIVSLVVEFVVVGEFELFAVHVVNSSALELQIILGVDMVNWLVLVLNVL